jgi:hypothetical protein
VNATSRNPLAAALSISLATRSAGIARRRISSVIVQYEQARLQS